MAFSVLLQSRDRLPTQPAKCYMAATETRERRRTLRSPHILVRQMVQMKNRVSALLMETGVSHDKQRLHKVGYLLELLSDADAVSASIRPLLVADGIKIGALFCTAILTPTASLCWTAQKGSSFQPCQKRVLIAQVQPIWVNFERRADSPNY